MYQVMLAVALMMNVLPQALPPGEASAPPAPESVMRIPDDLRRVFREKVLDTTKFPEERLGKLIKFVFDEDGLGMVYRSDSTHTVAESFHERQVNCLSSTLLIVALAREAGLKAQGQQVESVQVWGTKNEIVFQTRHANAIIEVTANRRFIVDIDASDRLAKDVVHPVSDEQLLAYFYGNRAMELMASGDLENAAKWSDTALQLSRNDASLWNNAGVLSLRAGDNEAAEVKFLRAFSLDSRQISVISNLIALYQRLGEPRRAAHWQAVSLRILKRAPYYQFQIGLQKEAAGDLSAAIRYFQSAIRLYGEEHRFHFALARTYFNLGKLESAERELEVARDLSDASMRSRYQQKLAMLKRML